MAETAYRVLATDKGSGRSLLCVRIMTGRTHQIRVHFSSIGHPLVGDPIYGNGSGSEKGRALLHAHTLTFLHPFSRERIKITAPIPPDFPAAFPSVTDYV